MNVAIYLITARTNIDDVHEVFRMNGIHDEEFAKLVKKTFVRPSESSDVMETKQFQRQLVQTTKCEILMIIGDNLYDLASSDYPANYESNLNILFDNPFAGN